MVRLGTGTIETSADYKSSATGTVNHESNLLSCEISLQVYAQIWQMICLYLRSGFRLSTDLTLARTCVYRLALETVERRKKMKSSIILNILSIINQCN